MNDVSALIGVTGLLVTGVLLFALGVVQVRERRPSPFTFAGPIYRGSADVIAGASMTAAALFLLSRIIPE